MSEARLDERMLRVVIALASVAMLAILLFPAYYATPDEAKYIGLGLNILDGRGLVTVFDGQFLNHSPVWPLALAAPQRLLGLDALVVGHVLNAIAAAITVALTGVLGWRVRPVVGALAAVMMLAFPFLASSARTAGLDLPSTALTLAFLAVALRALDRGSLRMALVSGVLFGLAFLVKETALPFFPVPFLVALLAPLPVRRTFRLAAAATTSAAITVCWWFVIDAQVEGIVYRLRTPAWTLAPIAVGLVGFILLGWNGDALATRAAALRGRVHPPAILVHRWRHLLAWGALAAWTLGQLAVYARTGKLAGQSLFRMSQWVADVHEYLPVMAVIAGFGFVGVLVALTQVRRSQGVRELAFASIAGIPLVLLVLGIGETPRHYLANIAVFVALAAAGWVHGLERARTDRRWAGLMAIVFALTVAIALRTPGTPVRAGIAIAAGLAMLATLLLWRALRVDRAAGSLAGHRPAPWTLAGLGALLAAGAIVFVAAAAYKHVDSDRAREQAVSTVSGWIEANVPAGDTVAMSSFLAYEIALAIRDDHPSVRLRPAVAVVDVGTPLGLRYLSDLVVETPLEINTALRNVDQLDVYAAELLGPQIREHRPTLWLDASLVGTGEGRRSREAMLEASNGIEPRKEWRFPLTGRELVVTAWSIDPDRVSFDESRTFADATTVEALIRLFGADGGGPGAMALADRLEISPGSPAGPALLAELRALGTGSPVASPAPTPSAP